MPDFRDYPEIFCTVDSVALRVCQGQLQVGLVKRESAPFEGQWALPGGFVRAQTDKDSLSAARRILALRGGAHPSHLEQLATYSGQDRDPRGFTTAIVYLALFKDEPGCFDELLMVWFDVSVISGLNLAFDHEQVIRDACKRLRNKAMYAHTPLYLMPSVFTLPQAQKVYESVLGRPLAKKSFRRWLEEAQVLKALNTKIQPEDYRPGRPAEVYSINRAVLENLE